LQQLTGSCIGFSHFVSEDQNEIELITWSSDTLARYCEATFDSHYPVSRAGLWADCVRSRQTVLVNDYASASGKKGLPQGHSALQRFISVPVFEQGLVRMVVGVGNCPVHYTETDVETVKLFATDLFRIVQRKRAQDQSNLYAKQLQVAFMEAVELATKLSEMRDPYTHGHERRVADIAVAIGSTMGFESRRLEGLRVAGLLHDVGKNRIPVEILSRPGKLSATEFLLIKEHARAGYDVLKDVKFPWPVAEITLQHHERMDGSGYPQGLKGEAILIDARILAVADTVEAMSSHRPYRAGTGIDKALAEIELESGRQFDSVVADACLRLFREKGYVIPD
jgi:HD-GYP domain-containing protein (c-di-GMP phosphodiesterase class II)